jgi:hypothetical protein
MKSLYGHNPQWNTVSAAGSMISSSSATGEATPVSTPVTASSPAPASASISMTPTSNIPNAANVEYVPQPKPVIPPVQTDMADLDMDDLVKKIPGLGINTQSMVKGYGISVYGTDASKMGVSPTLSPHMDGGDALLESMMDRQLSQKLNTELQRLAPKSQR